MPAKTACVAGNGSRVLSAAAVGGHYVFRGRSRLNRIDVTQVARRAVTSTSSVVGRTVRVRDRPYTGLSFRGLEVVIYMYLSLDDLSEENVLVR